MNKAMKTVLMLTAMLAAGCQDNAVAPRAVAPGQLVVTGGGFAGDLTGSDTARFDIYIDPKSASTFSLGSGNYLSFPARSLCEPSMSTYGPTEWDKPCVPATRPTTIHVKAWLDKNGSPRTDFTPNVRFVPSVIPTQWVMLTFSSASASYLGSSAIVYCADPTQKVAKCVNEAATDPSLATIKDPVTGQLRRRIKHFSGYSITTGEACNPSPDDPDCVSDGGDAFMNRAPSSVASFNNSGSSNASTTVNAITRDHSLPDHPTKDAWIGPMGGELRLPQAGATLIIPAGAVNTSTHFSITAVRGNFIAYEFEPHGEHFNVPLTLVQDLRGSSHRFGQSVLGAYFSDASNLDVQHGRAKVDELLSVTLNNALNQAVLPISHFSGYMMASGRGGE